jgi:hypothetical protein
VISAIFVGNDESHPGPGETPNWLYYWSLTNAVTGPERAALRYQETITDPNLPEAHPVAKYDHATQKVLLSAEIFTEHGCRAEHARGTRAPTGRQAQGIDCFAETVRHEWQHRQDAIDWWGGPAGPFGVSLAAWFARDWDHDQVPNEVEDREPGCRYGSLPSMTPAGGRETWFTCSSRPFADVTDAEINAYYVGWTWPLGSVNAADWSCGPLGKQWRGKKCGQ